MCVGGGSVGSSGHGRSCQCSSSEFKDHLLLYSEIPLTFNIAPVEEYVFLDCLSCPSNLFPYYIPPQCVRNSLLWDFMFPR